MSFCQTQPEIEYVSNSRLSGSFKLGRLLFRKSKKETGKSQSLFW